MKLRSELNSLLLEGKVVVEPVKSNEGCVFSMSNLRVAGKTMETMTIGCVVIGRKLADLCLEKMENLCGIRVVGRLGERGNTIILFADHIEFKPGGLNE